MNAPVGVNIGPSKEPSLDRSNSNEQGGDCSDHCVDPSIVRGLSCGSIPLDSRCCPNRLKFFYIKAKTTPKASCRRIRVWRLLDLGCGRLCRC